MRDLVEFALHTGDLVNERNFVGRNRALEGTRGHQRLQRSRPPGYRKEVRVSHSLDAGEFTLRIQGRIDGVLEGEPETLIEEIKTVEGLWNKEADPLHWAQARVYAFIFSHAHGHSRIRLRLVYLDLSTGETTEFLETGRIEELAALFARGTSIYIDWMRQHLHWHRERDASIQALEFPFQDYRPGQRDMAVAVYKAISRGERLFVEAPTGIGKTISVLFPAIKALATGKAERIFYLTARTTGAAIAEKAVEDMRQARLRLRSLTLTAKDKVCVRDGNGCDLQSCPLACGYYDRRLDAMRAALGHQALDRPLLERIGQQHQVCPYALSLDLLPWVDTVICDYNYVFDPQASLRSAFEDQGLADLLLVDEAHNLPDRAREIFSAHLDSASLQGTARDIRSSIPKCSRALAKLSSVLREFTRAPEHREDDESGPSAEHDLFSAPTSSEASTVLSEDAPNHSPTVGPSPKLLSALEKALDQTEAWLALNEPADFREALLKTYFELLAFAHTAERYDQRFRTITDQGQGVSLQLFCLDPSYLLRQVLNRARAAVFFSATLTPLEYYRQLLGGDPGDRTLRLASPFPKENLAVVIHQGIRTDLKAREQTADAVAEALGAVVQARQGNYLAYFPSYQYLALVGKHVREKFPTLSILVQRPGMSDAERAEFLAAFSIDRVQTQLGFAVLGGPFGEGIDLVGERLIGAVIVGVGLPQICGEREVIREYFQAENTDGFAFAYTFPGMNRVLQASGRVVRSEKDRGVVLLIDRRFGHVGYQRLFPETWRPRAVHNANQIRDVLNQFWRSDAAA